MLQIYIIDDHPILRKALRMTLEREPDFRVCGEASTAETGLADAVAAQPDFVLVDVSLPDMNGIELVAKLHEQHPNLPLAMLSGHREWRYVEQALEAGARGYILKGRADELPHAIRQMVRGEPYLSPALIAD